MYVISEVAFHTDYERDMIPSLPVVKLVKHENIADQTHQMTTMVRRMVATCRASKKSASGLPSLPILEMMAPKLMENTTRPSTFIRSDFVMDGTLRVTVMLRSSKKEETTDVITTFYDVLNLTNFIASES